jgi:hypothetical protein
MRRRKEVLKMKHQFTCMELIVNGFVSEHDVGIFWPDHHFETVGEYCPYCTNPDFDDPVAKSDVSLTWHDHPIEAAINEFPPSISQVIHRARHTIIRLLATGGNNDLWSLGFGRCMSCGMEWFLLINETGRRVLVYLFKGLIAS